MSNHYQIIDEKNWKRAIHCAAFRDCIEPAFCVTFEADITKFLQKTKQEKLSLTLSMTYAVCRCANEIEAFRYRFQDGNIVLFDRIDTAFTWLEPETELFKVVSVPLQSSLRAYVTAAKQAAEAQTAYFTGPMGNDVFQCSAMPWVAYTHVSHTNSGKKDDATPRFNWGKYTEKNGRIVMPVSVQAHHSFVDGIHIGRFVDALQNYLNGTTEWQ